MFSSVVTWTPDSAGVTLEGVRRRRDVDGGLAGSTDILYGYALSPSLPRSLSPRRRQREFAPRKRPGWLAPLATEFPPARE